MERLTLVVPYSGEIWLLDSGGKPYSLIVEGEDRYDEIKRLSEYEDIGLLPEQIIEVDRLYAEKCKELAELQKNNQWIPCSERLPADCERVLVWYEYFRYGDYNRMFQTYGIGFQGKGQWCGDVCGEAARCIAWQPLPEAYQKPTDVKAWNKLSACIAEEIE